MGRSSRKYFQGHLQELEGHGVPEGWAAFWHGRRSRISEMPPPESPHFEDASGVLLESMLERPLRAEERQALLDVARGDPPAYDPVLLALWRNERERLLDEATGTWKEVVARWEWERVSKEVYEDWMSNRLNGSNVSCGVLVTILQNEGYEEFTEFLSQMPDRQKFIEEEILPMASFWKEAIEWSDDPPSEELARIIWNSVASADALRIEKHQEYLASLCSLPEGDLFRPALAATAEKDLPGAARKVFMHRLRRLLLPGDFAEDVALRELDIRWQKWIEGERDNPLESWSDIFRSEGLGDRFLALPLHELENEKLSQLLHDLEERLDLHFYHTVSDQILDFLEEKIV